MSPALDGFLRSWPFAPWLVLSLLLPALVYLRGWLILHRRDPGAWHGGRLACFLGGLATLFLALGSPLEPFADLLLQAHMIQHLLFMMVAPPLIWLGSPLFPMLRGLPAAVRIYWVVPLLRSRRLRRLFGWLTHPAVALPVFVGFTWFWHAPPVYETALRSTGWHAIQHVCFLASGLLFWYPVVRPYPSRPRWSTWLLFPYLILADVQNTALSALLTFSDRVIYPHYTLIPRIGGLSALQDQSAAGVIMWVPGSLAYLLPLFVIGVRLLSGRGTTAVNIFARSSDRLKPGLQQRIPPVGVGVPPSGGIGAGSAARPRAGRGSPDPAQGPDRRSPALGVGSRSQRPLTRGPKMSAGDLRSGIRAGSGDPRPAQAGAGSRAGAGDPRPAQAGAGDPRPAQPRRGPGFDVLRLPLLGRFLKWRHARFTMQLPMIALAAVVILDGLTGPQVGAMNLAGVLPWIHWRGLLILGLLAIGNVFCMACPFMLPRTLARRWLPARLRWPRRLRSKWPAVILLVLFFWSYEAFSLWDSPWWTAWIAVGYFVLAFAIDGLFRGASFCKYVCPIGQFNFVQSLISPLEVKIRDADVCHSCRTKDCIRGNESLHGCELDLYLPRKAGNLDCTFCLDCVHACPHENVGILAVIPGQDLLNDGHHSGIGRLGERPDLAILIVLLVSGAFANATGMVAPVVEWQGRLGAWVGYPSPWLTTTAFYLVALIVLPVLLIGAATVLSHRWGGFAISRRALATRFSYSLVPLGFSMWLSHYTFHFLTSYGTVIPVVQRFAADFGRMFLGEPEWSCACCGPVADWLPRLEIVFLDTGLLLALFTGYRISVGLSARPLQALKGFVPWGLLSLILFAAGVWIVLQPMQMRGTMPGMS
jgi:cytochrome c oxidase assembly factor CtaG